MSIYVSESLDASINLINKQAEESILKQLNWLVSRGLLQIKIGESKLVREPGSDQVTLRQEVELVLKDKEYIESLENQIKAYKEVIENNMEKANQLCTELEDWAKRWANR